MNAVTADSLGCPEFKKAYGLRYAYLAGAMYKGIASKALVVAMGRAGMMGYFGAGGVPLAEVDAALRYIKSQLTDVQPFGMNLLCHPEHPELEERTVDLFIEGDVRNVEAAAFMRITPALARWRLKGLRRRDDGTIDVPHRVLAKVSRPEVASEFLQSAPASIVKGLLAAGAVTAEEAELSGHVPMADDLCVEADSGGHTDQGVAYTLMPAMLLLRDEAVARYRGMRRIGVGAAGGIGTPHAAAAAFIMGADFVLTGSINQCTVEAGTSDAVKDLLQDLNVQDTAYAPAGDMFEYGARIQVAKRGLFFPMRANKLYELYLRYNSLEEIDPKVRRQIEEKYFRRSFEEVWNESRTYYLQLHPAKLAEIEKNPKRKMAAIFKWYFVHSNRLAMRGSDEQRVDYQISCGPAMGAFNRWVKGTELESWRNRHVGEIATRLMHSTAAHLSERLRLMSSS
jgi:trans-AT polyketide synthase/acyltransferase/oxidoreductase domain-containing protein